MVDYKNIGLLVIVAILIIAPLVMFSGHGEDDGYFGGSDDAGGEAIEQPRLPCMGTTSLGTT